MSEVIYEKPTRKEKWFEEIEKIKKSHSRIAKAIEKSKMIDNEDKDELLYSINFILYIVNKYINTTRGGL